MKTLFKVKRFIDSNSLIQIGDRVLLAVSGGVDSMVLLNIMKDLSGIAGFEIGVAHINHQLRRDSHRDLMFVEEECRRLNIPFYGRDIYIFGGSKSRRRSLEQAAREERYNALFSIAEEFNYNLIATAHTKSDQAETLLMRIISGTSIKSLSGILVKRDGKIIRPLLCLTRTEVLEYAKGHNIRFVEDSTNSDTRYLRNKVRLQLIPFIKSGFNPAVEDALSTLAEDAANLRGILTEELSKFTKIVSFNDDCSIARFDRNDFLRIPQELRRYFILEIISRMDVSKRIDSENIRSAIELILNSKGSRFYRLSTDFVVRCEYDQVSIGKLPHIKEIYSDLTEFEPLVVKEYGIYKLYWVDIEIGFEYGIKERKNYPQIFLSLEKFDFPFTIRIFEDGDRIYSQYYKKYVKLKKVLINKKIPIRLRKIMPVISAQDEILWVPGVIRSGIGSPEKGDEKLTITVYNYEPDLIKYIGPFDEYNGM